MNCIYLIGEYIILKIPIASIVRPSFVVDSLKRKHTNPIPPKITMWLLQTKSNASKSNILLKWYIRIQVVETVHVLTMCIGDNTMLFSLWNFEQICNNLWICRARIYVFFIPCNELPYPCCEYEWYPVVVSINHFTI